MAEAKAFKMIPHCTKDTITYEMEELVMCKDCKHRGKAEKCVLAAISEEKDYLLFMLDNRGEWFCADGRKRE